MSQTIYLAARYSRREELCGYRAKLTALGYHVTGRWLDGAHQVSDAALAAKATDEADQATTPERMLFALEDLEDLTHADTIIAFTEPQQSSPSRGGRHVELGIAIGQGKRVIVVGHRENVFTCLPTVEFFETWAAAFQLLQVERALAVSRRHEDLLDRMQGQLEGIARAIEPRVASHPYHAGERRVFRIESPGACAVNVADQAAARE